MKTTLIVHALVAPLAFGLLTWRYVKRFPDAAPFVTSITMLGVVVVLDSLVVAPLKERSYAMFKSVIGTWLPFASILLASYLVASRTARREGDRPSP